jgi:alkanesulfonate monooxygenase SsuD/methylene tetrahydromethanopterin reductase-like flavin-dependent oxidoreductase (luciferase family)
MIGVLRKLWGGGMVEHHGEHFDFDRLEVSPAPDRPIPIHIGGNSKAALRRAAALGDGWIGAGHLPDQIPEVLSELRRLRREAPRTPDQPDPDRDFEAIVSVSAPPDVQRLQRLAEQGMTGYVNWPFKYLLGPESSLDEKRAVMERFAEQIIAPISRG